jgi:predicted AAA+ superfamily ATPase
MVVVGKTGLPSTGTKSFGDIFESFVVNEIWKQIEYNSLNWETSYLRTKTQLEADMIISNGKDMIAVEIKSSQKIDPSHIKKLYSVMELVPEIKYGIIISLDPSGGKISDKIVNLPVWAI